MFRVSGKSLKQKNGRWRKNITDSPETHCCFLLTSWHWKVQHTCNTIIFLSYTQCIISLLSKLRRDALCRMTSKKEKIHKWEKNVINKCKSFFYENTSSFMFSSLYFLSNFNFRIIFDMTLDYRSTNLVMIINKTII